MRENKIHRIEVHVGCICLDGDNVLILKRTPERRIYPGFWECGGGQVWSGESFEDAAARELSDEAGVMAKPVAAAGTYEILVPDDEQKKIPGVYFACRFLGYQRGTEPSLSEEHSEWKWVPVSRLEGIGLIPGLKKQINKAHDILKNEAGKQWKQNA